MSFTDRVQLIQILETSTQSKVITLVTGDKEPINVFGSQIAPDCVPRIGDLLKSLQMQPKISLFLYSRGGDANIPWRIVTLIRQYTKNMDVLIPFRAHSAATMIALGANTIQMGPLGELTQVDPALNIRDSQGRTSRVGVEDVIGYINLSREKVGIRGRSGAIEVLRQLSGSVQPVTLGQINRTHSLIRLYTKKLLSMHSSGLRDWLHNKRATTYLTEKLFSHYYTIGRDEAKEELKLKVSIPNEQLENTMWRLWEQYRADLGIESDLNPSASNETYLRVFIESANISHVFSTTYTSYDVSTTGQISGRIGTQGWIRELI